MREIRTARESSKLAFALPATRSAVVEVVESFLYGAKNKDFYHVPMAPDMVMETPLCEELRGAEAIAEHLMEFAPVVTGVKVWGHVVEGERCTTRFDWETLHGTIPAMGFFRISDGALAEVRTFYNLRVLTEGITREAGAAYDA